MEHQKTLETFWRRLTDSERSVLLLDYDGTLAPFRVERDQAVPYAGVRKLLEQIRNRTATRLVVVSGRAIDDLRPLLGLEPPPEIWGCHGWERLAADGRRPELDLPAPAEEGLRQARRWIAEEGLDDRCELKPASLALHWRGLPEQEIEALRARISAGWEPIAARAGLAIHPFNGGLELRCPGRDKGTAVRAILAEIDPGVPIAFLGDDLTDEDGFEALAGHGLGVLVSGAPRQTHADLRIAPPDGLLAFFDAWLEKAPRGNDTASERDS